MAEMANKLQTLMGEKQVSSAKDKEIGELKESIKDLENEVSRLKEEAA